MAIHTPENRIAKQCTMPKREPNNSNLTQQNRHYTHLPRAQIGQDAHVFPRKVCVQEIHHPGGPTMALRDQRYVLDFVGTLSCECCR